MKKYFNKADIIVFGITIIGISIIIAYKFFWINKVPVLNNTDITADIFYTISTSIVASGFFYLVTIFIPKYFEINKMILHLTKSLSNLDYFIDILLMNIYNSNTNKNYNKEDFISSMETNTDRVEQDYLTYLSKSNSSYNIVQELINLYISIFSTIIDSHSKLLPKEIYIEIIELCRSSNQVNKVFDYFNPKSTPIYNILDINRILKIRNKIKSYYNIK